MRQEIRANAVSVTESSPWARVQTNALDSLEVGPYVRRSDRDSGQRLTYVDSFAESVRLWCSERSFQNVQAHLLQGRIELREVAFVAVVDEKPVRALTRGDLLELLKCPSRGGISCIV
jgi:hypothetical protein